MKLKQIRKLRGLSIDQLAELSGVDANIIAKLESGRADTASTKALLSIAHALNSKVDTIF